MASHAYSTLTPLLSVVPHASTLLGAGLRHTPAGSPVVSTEADRAIEAIREGVDRYLRDTNTVQAQRGVAYLRRGAWAAFLHTGERIGHFPSAREATAALGGVA